MCLSANVHPRRVSVPKFLTTTKGCLVTREPTATTNWVTPRTSSRCFDALARGTTPLGSTSVFRICDTNVQGLDVQEAHIRARSKSERAPMKTFMYVQNLELRACTPLVPGIFWPRKIQNFGAPGMNAGVRPKHERIRTNTFIYVQVLDVHGKY